MFRIFHKKNEKIKTQLEKKNTELLREHKYLRDKITNLQLEIKKKSDLEENFNQEIEELNKYVKIVIIIIFFIFFS